MYNSLFYLRRIRLTGIEAFFARNLFCLFILKYSTQPSFIILIDTIGVSSEKCKDFHGEAEMNCSQYSLYTELQAYSVLRSLFPPILYEPSFTSATTSKS